MDMENEEVRRPRRTSRDVDVTIHPPSFQRATIRIIGTSPYVQHRFGQKALGMMRDKQLLGTQANKKRGARQARDFDEDYRQALHTSREGWHGISASAFRKAMISACRLVGYKMTLAKLSLFVEADGIDDFDRSPLVKIIGTPIKFEAPVIVGMGTADISIRPLWDEWSADVRCKWDSQQFSAGDIVNLLARVGEQVGIGEGRHDSKKSTGMGWGCFRVAESGEE